MSLVWPKLHQLSPPAHTHIVQLYSPDAANVYPQLAHGSLGSQVCLPNSILISSAIFSGLTLLTNPRKFYASKHISVGQTSLQYIWTPVPI